MDIAVTLVRLVVIFCVKVKSVASHQLLSKTESLSKIGYILITACLRHADIETLKTLSVKENNNMSQIMRKPV